MIISQRFILVGPHAGKTIALGPKLEARVAQRLGRTHRYQFQGGACVVQATEEGMRTIERHLATYYQAYPEGSDALKDGEARFAEAVREKELEQAAEMERRRNAALALGIGGPTHGYIPPQPPAVSRPPEPVPSDVRSSGNGAPPQAADDGGADDHPEAGGAGVRAEGGGEDSERLTTALHGLDPAVEEHWTKGGKPSLDYLSRVLGRTVKRAEVEGVAPGLERGEPRSEG